MKNLPIILILILTNFSFCFAQDLRINELMPRNETSGVDGFGKSSDWVEIYNNSNGPIQISNYYLSNNFSNKLKWQLPSKVLASHSWVLIYCSDKDLYSPEYHANFKLKNELDTLGIFFQDGSTIDVLVYGKMPMDVSYGRKPDGQNSLVYFEDASPNASNNFSLDFSCVLDKPSVDTESGFYPSPKNVSVSHPIAGVQLRYTRNGDTPNSVDFPYTQTLNLATDYSPNRLSLIPTNPQANAPIGSYTVSRANNRGWLAPKADVQNINVFKVRAFKLGCIPSEVTTRTFILDDGNTTFPDMPIISIQTDSFGLFSNDTGIYVFGGQTLGNYLERGKEWERPIFLEYFDQDKNLLISQKMGGELHGNGSRHSTQKNFRVSANRTYGKSRINANIFGDSPVNEFKHLLVRSPGHRPDCMPRDELATLIVANIGFDIQNYKTSIMYLNGEYWGIHVLKERFDADFLSIKYDMDKDDIVMLEMRGDLEHGVISDTNHYKNMMQYVKTNSLDIPQNMTYLNTQMDIDNYIDYMASEIYIGNGDWPNNNMRFWRKRVSYDNFASTGHDGRWRWMFFDLDGGFGGSCDEVYYATNSVSRALSTSSSKAKYTQFFRDLCSNQSFRDLFINRSCDLLNTTFSYQVVKPKLDEVVNQLNPLMLEHIERWGYPSVSDNLADRINETPSLDQWDFLVTRFNKFAVRRKRKILDHMQEQWLLSDTSMVTMDVNDATMGYVQMNSLKITADLDGVNIGVYPWTGMYFNDINIPIKAVAYPGFRFKEWLGLSLPADTRVYLKGDISYTAIFEIDPNYEPLLPVTINEIQAWNTSTAYNEYFDYADWIELYNPNDVAVDITGYYLTDNRDKLTKYELGPAQTIIPAKDWIVFWADGKTGRGINHTNFSLAKDGEFVALVASDGVTVVDSISYGPQNENYSYGRESDGLQPWISFKDPTPFYSNLSTSITEHATSVAFKVYPNPNGNEILFFNTTISGEIYNVSGVQVKSFEQVNSLSISYLRSGLYFIRNRETGETVKLVVQ